MNPDPGIRATIVGFKAHAALERTGGAARVLATLSGSIYLDAGGEIVWLGREGASLHPRGILIPELPLASSPGDVLAIDLGAACSWRPPEPPLTDDSTSALVTGCRRLLARIDALGPPEGFGALLAGAPPPFPLDGLAPRARVLASACARDDPRAAAEAALTLLGAGPGLTPAGDDYVGGVFFARALFARAGAADGPAWRAAADDVLSAASRATHPISAALLSDLLEAQGWKSLHDLVDALFDAGPIERALLPAKRLVAIGHSSGWDILAGVVAGTLGRLVRDDA